REHESEEILQKPARVPIKFSDQNTADANKILGQKYPRRPRFPQKKTKEYQQSSHPLPTHLREEVKRSAQASQDNRLSLATPHHALGALALAWPTLAASKERLCSDTLILVS